MRVAVELRNCITCTTIYLGMAHNSKYCDKCRPEVRKIKNHSSYKSRVRRKINEKENRANQMS